MVVQTLCIAEPSNVRDFLSLTSLTFHFFIFDSPFTDSFYNSNGSADAVLLFIRSNLHIIYWAHFSLGCFPPVSAILLPQLDLVHMEAAVILSWDSSFTAVLGPISWTLVLACLDLFPCLATEHFLVVVFIFFFLRKGA